MKPCIFLVGRMIRGLRGLYRLVSTGMAFEGSLVLAGFEFPHFDGAVFGGGGYFGIVGVEGE